jgi:hypothetical protein
MKTEMRTALDTFTMLATVNGMSFAGMVIGIDPPALYVIGNVTERGHDIAKLFRQYADLLDGKTDAGQVQIEQHTGTIN